MEGFQNKNWKDLDQIKPFEDFIDAILLDSWNKDTYGGSGQKIKSNHLKNIKFTKPWWLAGGISTEWIDEIINEIKPYGIDVSSSVEIKPGVKDLKEAERLIKYLKKY